MRVFGCFRGHYCSCPSFILTLRLASTSAASTAAWAFSRRRCSAAYSTPVSQWRASALRAASSPESPERSRAVSLVTSCGSCGPDPLPPEHPTPPGPPCALLGSSRSGVGLAPTLLPDRKRLHLLPPSCLPDLLQQLPPIISDSEHRAVNVIVTRKSLPFVPQVLSLLLALQQIVLD
jgi:hypothetical protein